MIKLIGYLVVIAAIVFGVGLALDWWSVSKEGDGLNVSMTDKGKETMEKAKDTVGDIGRKVGDAVAKIGKESAEGKVVVAAGDMLTVLVDEKPLVLKLDNDAKVFLNEKKVSLDDLRPGDTVEVAYDEKEDGIFAAVRVTATR